MENECLKDPPVRVVEVRAVGVQLDRLVIALQRLLIPATQARSGQTLLGHLPPASFPPMFEHKQVSEESMSEKPSYIVML